MGETCNSSNYMVLGVAALALIGGGAFYLGKSNPAQHSASLDTEQVQVIVKDYLMSNPEVIMDSLNKWRQDQAIAQQKQAAEGLRNNMEKLVGDKESPVAGNPNGDVTVVEFFDYNCGYCKRSLTTVQQVIAKDKNIRFVFKEFPILSESSEMMARAAIAVNRIAPEKYFDFHSALMKVSGKKDEAAVLAMVTELGLDADKVKEEMKSQAVSDLIARDRKLAQDIGIRGTPAFVVGEELAPGALQPDQLLEMVQRARAQNGGSAQPEADNSEDETVDGHKDTSKEIQDAIGDDEDEMEEEAH